MREINTKRLATFVPATAIAMYCLTPTYATRDVNWGDYYEGIGHRTANNVVSIPGVLPRTAAVVNLLQSEPSQNDSPWKQPLNELRSDLHATVSQIARALSVRRQSVHAWQRGDKDPSADSQIRISQLQLAAVTLKAALGWRLPTYLNYPLGENGETFWDIVSAGSPAPTVASKLVEAATASIRRRKALDDLLEGKLGAEPLDGHV